MFSPVVLPNIESAYQIFTMFSEYLRFKIEVFRKGITKKELVNVIRAHKDVIDEALKVLKKE